MSWIAAASAGGTLLSGAMGGGGGAAPAPINNTANFGAVNFGDKYLGSDAVAKAPDIINAGQTGAVRWVPWIVAGVLGLVALILLFLRRRK